jgi:hypothetical protein
MKYFKQLLLVLIGFAAGWLAYRHSHKLISIPMSPARLEVPVGCQPRVWMNGIETDCRNEARMYWTEHLKQASPK